MKLRPPVTIPIVFVQGMISGVEAHGMSPAPFLAEAGIAFELLHEPGARVTAEQYIQLFRVIIERLDDECFGLMSRPVKRGSVALITRSAIGAPSLEVAMRRIRHSFRLLQDDLVLELVSEGDAAGLALRFVDHAKPHAIFLHEALLRFFWRLLAWLVNGRLPATRFDFAFASPSNASLYEEAFPAPLQFDCQYSAFWFDAAWLQRPVRRDEAALRSFLAEAQREVITPRHTDNLLSARVREQLIHTLPVALDLAAIANRLNMSPSTVQRRLAKEDTSFQALKDELRRDLAIVRLNSTNVPLSTLAYELGFADSAAFQRAFKVWTGSAPGTYRRLGN